MTLEAHIVGTFEHRVASQVVKEPVTLQLEPRLAMQPFVLGPDKRLLRDSCLEFPSFAYFIFQKFAVRCTNRLFTLRTLKERKNDTGSVPPLTQYLVEAVQVEHVFAANRDGGLFTKATRVTDLTVVVSSAGVKYLVFISRCLIKLLNTFFLQTRQAVLFIFESMASMTALVHLITAPVHQLDAFSLTTHIFESRDHAYRCTMYFLVAEAAFACF